MSELVSVPPASSGLPSEFSLKQNYPNPFNPTTTIRYELPRQAKVSLKVYSVLGQEVVALVNAGQPAGHYSVVLNGQKLPSGVYFCRLQALTNRHPHSYSARRPPGQGRLLTTMVLADSGLCSCG